MGAVGGGSLLVNDCDSLILLLGQAFVLDPAEDTLLATDRLSFCLMIV